MALRVRPPHAVLGWALAASVYLLAVLHRTSLGVAGLLAEQRFGISPAQLSIFIFLQLGVYAAMQVPTGILVDRYGPRRVLVAAATLMGAAQLVFALVPLYPVALLARAALGCGDALTFISVLRFAATHFAPRRYPLLVATTAMFGTVGNIVATLPLALVLRHLGWTPAFAAVAVLSLAAGTAVAALLPDATPTPRPVRSRSELRRGAATVLGRVRTAWALPGTRLGFWTHFTAMSSATAFGVLWGTPYLVEVLGVTTAGASTVLLAGVVLAAAVSPVYGWVIGRHPPARVPIALAVSALTVAGLIGLVVAGARPPTPFVIALFVVLATGVPVSMAAFALARDYNHHRTLGTASGLVNVGGFLAAVLIALGIGAVLDALGGITAHALRWSLLVAIGVQSVGGWRLVVWYLRVRRQALHRQSLGHEVPVFVVRRRFDLPLADRLPQSAGRFLRSNATRGLGERQRGEGLAQWPVEYRPGADPLPARDLSIRAGAGGVYPTRYAQAHPLHVSGVPATVATKIKLTRIGKMREPHYRIVVADSRNKRDGRSIETIGEYHPKNDPSVIKVDGERAAYWLGVGAQPTEAVRAILKVTGDWQKFKGEPAPEPMKVAPEKPDKQALFNAALAEAGGDTTETGGAATTPKKKTAAKKTSGEPKAETKSETPDAAEPVAEAPAETPSADAS